MKCQVKTIPTIQYLLFGYQNNITQLNLIRNEIDYISLYIQSLERNQEQHKTQFTMQNQNQMNNEILSNHYGFQGCVQQSSFKAWEADSIMEDNVNNLNLLNNFKSLLANYQKKYNKQNSHKTIKLKLPSLSKIRKIQSGVSNSCFSGRGQTMTCRGAQQTQITDRLNERKTYNTKKNKQNQNKSIELKKYSSKALKTRQCNLLRQGQQKSLQHNPLIKIHQMKFGNNTKHMKKRDIYLAIFGQKNRNKVQRLIPDQDKQNYQYKKSNPSKNKIKTQKTIQF